MCLICCCLTNLLLKVNVFPGVGVEFVSICQQSKDVVTCVTVGLDEFDVLLCVQLKEGETKISLTCACNDRSNFVTFAQLHSTAVVSTSMSLSKSLSWPDIAFVTVHFIKYTSSTSLHKYLIGHMAATQCIEVQTEQQNRGSGR